MRGNLRALVYKRRANSPFLRKPQVCGKLCALTERRGFRTRRKIFFICSSEDSVFSLAFPLGGRCHEVTEEGRSPSFYVTLSSSSHAYAVSILPIGKMHDLQGGSSSSQKSRCAAIFGSPVFPCSRSVSFCHFDREGLKARRVEKSCAQALR